jgi:uncharacterized protein YndB with AHSA1/START domain
MIHAESTTTIRRPVTDVFVFATDPTKESRWHTDVASASIQGSSPPSVGSRIDYRFSRSGGGGGATAEITALEPGLVQTIAVEHGPMGTKPTITLRFASTADGTRFTREVSIMTSGASRVFEPVLRRLAARRNATFVDNLRKLLEEP